MAHKSPDEVLNYWFSEAIEAAWFSQSDAVDQEIADHFTQIYDAARNGELSGWRDQARDALALTIVLDQFPRNLFRGSPRSFESDSLALANSKHAIDAGFDAQLSKKERAFFYLPFMHSEKIDDQQRCITLYEELGNSNGLDFAHQHANIIKRFGRFPHRNAVLGRQTTAEEAEFLKEHSGF